MRHNVPIFAASLVLVLTCGCSWKAAGSRSSEPPGGASPVVDGTWTASQPRGLFDSEVPLHFVLEADFQLLDGDRGSESEERPGRIVIPGFDGEMVEVPLKVKTRGRFRLRPNICAMPPLRLNFPTSEPRGTVFDGQDKLKVVTHCKNRNDYEQNLLEEYLAYRLYNFITDVSFRVRLAEITYIDTSGKHNPVSYKAFLIEDQDALATRLGGEILDIPGAEPAMLDPGVLGLSYLFQYMIGNTDWSIDSGHNIKFIRSRETTFAVPFDFDFSGLVDAPYALPAPSVANYIHSVRDRLYRGHCVVGIDQEAALARFRETRPEMLSLVETQPGLSFFNRLSARRYLEEFFEGLGYPGRVELDITGACLR